MSSPLIAQHGGQATRIERDAEKTAAMASKMMIIQVMGARVVEND